eukprot:12466146-Alexandrium_andersonii.AAC.1
MSASLVGSEMCIRDSPSPLEDSPLQASTDHVDRVWSPQERQVGRASVQNFVSPQQRAPASGPPPVIRGEAGEVPRAR